MERLSGLDGVSWQKIPAHGTPAPSLLTGVLKGMDRAAFLKKLSEAAVDSGIYYPKPLHKQPVFERLSPGAACPKAEAVCEKVFSLPTHHALTGGQMEYMADRVREALA